MRKKDQKLLTIAICGSILQLWQEDLILSQDPTGLKQIHTEQGTQYARILLLQSLMVQEL